jgi:hypothetical protein
MVETPIIPISSSETSTKSTVVTETSASSPTGSCDPATEMLEGKFGIEFKKWSITFFGLRLFLIIYSLLLLDGIVAIYMTWKTGDFTYMEKSKIPDAFLLSIGYFFGKTGLNLSNKK